MVKLGEVEFLVKFDTVGKSFKDVLEDSLKDMDVGGIDDDTSQKIDQIWYDLKQQYRITGQDRTYAQFIYSDLPNIINWWNNPDNIKQLTKDIMASPASIKSMGLDPEQYVDKSEELVTDMEERVGELGKLILREVDRAAKNEEYWDKNSDKLGKALSNAKEIMTSKNIIQPMNQIKMLLNEYTDVTKTVERVLDSLKIEYISKGKTGERQFSVLYTDVGEGEEGIESTEFINKLAAIMGQEAVQNMILDKKILNADKQDWKDALEEIFKEFFLKKGVGIPIPIAQLLAEDVFPEKAEDIYRTGGEGIRRAPDIITFFEEGQSEKFAKAMTKALGKKWETAAAEWFKTEGITEGIELFEAKKTSTAILKPELGKLQTGIVAVMDRADERFKGILLNIEENTGALDQEKLAKDVIVGVGKAIIETLSQFAIPQEMLDEIEQALQEKMAGDTY